MKIKDLATGALVALTATSFLLAGCSKHQNSSSSSNSGSSSSSGSSASGTGGDMTCKAFLAQDKNGKIATIEAFLSSRGQSTSKSNITATRLSAEAFCRTTGKDKYVKNVETG